MSADQIGIALKGRRNGNGWLVSCPCPNHGKGRGDRSPSLSVADGDDGRLLLRCFAGCEFVDVLDELEHRGLVEDERVEPREQLVRETPHEPNTDALIIWRASEPLPHTIAAEYLERRGIALQPPSLRCRIGKPALIAAVQAPDGKVIAIQQTRLTSKGEKAGRALLEIYREANRAARSAAAPAYFAKPYAMERIIYAGGEPDTTAREHLRQMIAETQELLKQQVAAIQAAFDKAVQSYREIDQLFPEKNSG